MELKFQRSLFLNPILPLTWSPVASPFYYAVNVPFTIREMHRVPENRRLSLHLWPMPDNKKMFYDIIREATGQTIPPMPAAPATAPNSSPLFAGYFPR